MINLTNGVRCSCGKLHLLDVVITEGWIDFYCPRCKSYTKLSASTAQTSALPLNREFNLSKEKRG